MSGDRDSTGIRERLRTDWQRWALLAAPLVMAAFAWREPTVAVFAAVPVLIWWGGPRSIAKGLVLLAITAWILLPRELGLSGGWVPSIYEVCLFVPIITAMLGVATRKGWMRALTLTVFAVMGILSAGWTAMLHSEGDTGNEGVRPGPSGLQIVEVDGECGSGGCTKAVEVTGDRAAERMRAHLSAQGFKAGPDGKGRCRVHGLLIPYKVCAGVREISPTTARVSWFI